MGDGCIHNAMVSLSTVHCPSNIFSVFPFISFTAIPIGYYPTMPIKAKSKDPTKSHFLSFNFRKYELASFSVEGGREETNSSLDRRDALPRFMATQTPI